MSIALSCEELTELTLKRRPGAQAKELEHLGIPHRRRRDGTLIVLRVHAEAAMGAPVTATIKRRPQLQP